MPKKGWCDLIFLRHNKHPQNPESEAQEPRTATSRFPIDLFIDPPEDEFLCNICKDVLNEPLITPCQHAFCRACIQRVSKVNGRPKLCPVCLRQYRKIDLHPPPVSFKIRLRKLEMKCQNRGCRTIITLEDYFNHKITCGFSSVGCLNCNRHFLKKDLDQHVAKCEFRQIACPHGCGESIQHRDIDIHSLSSCSQWTRL